MRKLVYISALVFILSSFPKLAQAQEITIFPNSPSVGNCFPFGTGHISGPGDTWTPFMGFIYRNIPPFKLVPGDVIAFDLGALNSADVQLDIELAATTSNGGDLPVLPFVKIVSNTHTPLNPNGDTILGDFEMQFTVEAPFSFPGGGLIIRFSNPSAAYQTNTGCDQVLVHTDSSDTSGFFVARFFSDPDGVPPYLAEDTGDIGAFRVITSGGIAHIPTLSEWGMIIAAAGLGLVGVFFAVRRKRFQEQA